MSFELNKYQKKAVEYYGEKPLLIEAGPGSGKTRVIIERVKFLLKKNMDPESFLIITFSNKAAHELKDRLKEDEDIDDDTVNSMQISTVHSFCYKLLMENTNINYKILDDDYGTKKNMFIYKHRERLGFKRESTLTRGKVKAVVDTFDKYSTFNVDTKKLVEYIKENEPVSEDYLHFIDEEFSKTGKFPRNKIILDNKKKNLKNPIDYHNYDQSWYNALHLQVAKAYPIYLKLLEEYNYLDFNVLQIKALEFLRENPKTQYKNILVDEFQDTDPIQIEIFEILMKNAINPKDYSKKAKNNKKEIGYGSKEISDKDKITVSIESSNENIITASNDDLLKENEITASNDDLLKENEITASNDDLLKENEITASFTAVGDMDQSIYGFRGALENYFQYFYNKYDTERIGLKINYRSTDEIIEFSEEFIKKQRDKDSKKSLEGARNESREIFFLENEEVEMEAANIAKIIKGLKENNIIENYNDVAILLRSVINSSKAFIDVFEDENIPFQIKGLKNLDQKDEIRSILTLLHFIIEDENPEGTPIISTWEKDWLNLRAFTNADFTQKFVELSDETKNILIEKQKDFENSVLAIGKSIYKEITGKATRKRSYAGILELEDEIVDEIFKQIKKPVLTNETLIEYGITNPHDLAFFNRLNSLRSRIFDVNDYNERPTILDVYYEILEICGFLDEDFIYAEENNKTMEHIGLFTQIIYEYENIISNRDIRGLYWFLNSNIKNYSYDIEDESGVNIMTIHKSKGLEFPVVILGALNDSSFPREYENLKDINYKNGSPVFYTPRECFRHKSLDKDDVLLHYEEEERNIYVAMTRAQDLLILSKNTKMPRKTPYSKSIQKEIDDIELNEKINQIKEEIEELKKAENINDASFILTDLKDELKEVKDELKEIKTLSKEHFKLVGETKRLENLIVEIKWKIDDIKYEDKVLDELITLFGLDNDILGLNRDQINDLILNKFSSDADDDVSPADTVEDLGNDFIDSSDLGSADALDDGLIDGSDLGSTHDLSNKDEVIYELADNESILLNNDETIDKLADNESILLNNDETIDKLADNESILLNNDETIDKLADNDDLEDYFEDKQDLSDILGAHESEIYDLSEKISDEDDETVKLINKLMELQENEFSNKKSEVHSKFKMEIQEIIEDAINNNEDEKLSKNQIALDALYDKLKSLESTVSENNETIESNSELLDKEKSLEGKRIYLDYKIKIIKDEDNFDAKYNLEYNLTPQEEFMVIRDLDELSKVLIGNDIADMDQLIELREKALESGNLFEYGDKYSEKLIDLVLNDDEFVKLELLFKIKNNENIENLKDIGTLKEKDEFDKVTQRYFMSFHFKKQEMKNKKVLNFITNKKRNLYQLINTYPGVVKLAPGDIRPILSQRKIPNAIELDNDKKVFLSYSSIESYESCPLKYHLGYDFKFRISDNPAILQGNINHNSLEEINKIIISKKEEYAENEGIEIDNLEEHLNSLGKDMDNEYFISKEEIKGIVEKIYYDDANIDRNEITIEDVLANIFGYWENYGRKFNVLGSEYRFDISKEDKFTLIGSIDLLYKSKEGIVILDYKTTKNISDEAQRKYKKQLYTYALALRDDPIYSEEPIDKLQIYAIKSKDMLDFDLDMDKLNQRERDIDVIASNLMKNYYPHKSYNKNSNDCYYCKYSFICNKA